MSPNLFDYSEWLADFLESGTPGLILYARQWFESAAEDVVHDAIVKLLQEKPPPDSPRAWLFRVVRNEAINRRRRENRYRQESVPNWFEDIAERFPDEPLFDGAELTRALDKLEPVWREIVVSKIWGGLTFKEIAELTGRPSSSVHWDYQRALERLREILEQ